MSLLKGSNTTTRSEKLDSIQVTVSEFGAAVPLLYGRCLVSPNLINYQDFASHERKKTVSSGKAKSTTITYIYTAYLELALGQGPIKSIGAVWVQDKKYNNLSALNAGAGWTTDADVDKISYKSASKKTAGAPLSINLGNNSNPTAYMTSKHSDIAVGYDSLAYLYGFVMLGEDSASVPSYKIEVNAALQDDNADGIDANPACIIRDILAQIGVIQERTDGNGTKYWSNLDADSFANYVNYCREADLLVSTPSGKFNSQAKAQTVVQELLTLTNTYMYWNGDRFYFVPRDDRAQGDWVPNTSIMYDLGPDELALNGGGVVNFKRKDSSEVYNYITVKFTNRSNDFETESVTYQDVDNIRDRGVKSITLEALWLHTKERAVKYAKAYARKCLTEINQYTLKLSWEYARLTPGDLLRVTDSNLGLVSQVMMVSEVQEDSKGLLTVTAVQRAAGTYSESAYTVADSYNSQNFNVEPSDTADPVFIIPPADLVSASANGLEVWIALHGKSQTWGGCDVYVSDKDGDYTLFDKQGTSATYGKLNNAITKDSTSLTVTFSNPNSVSLLAGSAYDAQAGNTLIWVNGECMSYTEAELVSGNKYNLKGLLRGQYSTSKVVHQANEDVVVLDSSIFVVPLTKHYLGKTLYTKFPSFNTLQGNTQSIADLDPYTCTVAAADLPNCTIPDGGIYSKYREMADDVTRYDIVVNWNPPSGFASYQQAQVWYKTNGIQGNALGYIAEGKAGSELGFEGRWQYGGQGYNSVIIPQAVIGDTYKIAVCTQDVYGNVESPDMSSKQDYTVAMKSETPNTPANPGTKIADSFVVYWDEVRNADIKYYEIRTDANVGEDNGGLVGRTTETSISTNEITNRQGTIYIYAVSAYNKASAPATVTYSYYAPAQPVIKVNAKLDGIECISSAIPNSCNGIHWFFAGTDSNVDVKSQAASYFYAAAAGVYEVTAKFYDYFGDGAESGASMVTVLAYIPPEMIAAETFNYNKMAAAAKSAIAEASTENINIAVSGIMGAGTALVMQDTGYALVASNGNKLTGLFADEQGTLRLQGDYVHITGTTKFDNGIIANNVLAGGITADKLNVTSLGAVTATLGTVQTAASGARITIVGNKLTVYDSNNNVRVELGVL